jgi:hypothetical protein
VGHRDLVSDAKARFLSWYAFAEYEPSELEAAVVSALREQFETEEVNEITIGPKEIVEKIDDTCFHANDSLNQKATKVGWAIKKFNLASEKARSGKGQSYRFRRDKIEAAYQTYFSPSEPAQLASAPEASALPPLDDVQVEKKEGDQCKNNLHDGNPALETCTDKGQKPSDPADQCRLV